MKPRISFTKVISLALTLTSLASVSGKEDPRAAAKSGSQNGAQVTAPGAVSNNPLPSAAKTEGTTVSEVPKPAPSQPSLSVWASEVAKLAKAGVSEDIMLSFVDLAGTFNVGADQIISLKQAGVPQSVITAMIQHDADIVAGIRQVSPSTIPLPESTPLLSWTKAHSTAVETGHTAELSGNPPAPVSEASWSGAYEWAAYMPPSWNPEPDAPEQPIELFPVRKPYAVKLTDPIWVYPGTGRMPNIVLLQDLR